MIHTRDIISKLSYDNLVADNNIPDIFSVMENYTELFSTKKYPPFVYKTKDFMFFGMFMDYVLRGGLRVKLQHKIPINLGHDIHTFPNEMRKSVEIYETSNNVFDIMKESLKIVTHIYSKESYQFDDVKNYIGKNTNIIKSIESKFINYIEIFEGGIYYNKEYEYKDFFGHPDIVSKCCVLDIKTTSCFKKMSKEACLQVLVYYALIKQKNKDIKYVGFILPMQENIFLCDISSWDCSSFLDLINDKAIEIKNM